jgi:hypothetical protein
MVARVDAETTCWNFSGPNDAVGQFELATVAHFASDKQNYRRQSVNPPIGPKRDVGDSDRSFVLGPPKGCDNAPIRLFAEYRTRNGRARMVKKLKRPQR